MAHVLKFFAIAVLAVCAVNALTPDEILDSCEASGREIGGKNTRLGCSAVNSKCDIRIAQKIIHQSSAAAVAKLDVDDLVQGAVDRTCDTLFKNNCLRAALEDVNNIGDDKCSSILTNGPQPNPECGSKEDAVRIFNDALKECKNPCACSEDGVANGIQTDRRGCKQHLKQYNDFDYFCYVVNSNHCTKEKTTESTMFPGTYWIICG